MTATHTLGPWGSNELFAEECKGQITVSSRTGGNVATVIGRTLEEAKANARLIAAAPELLEACKLALPFVQDVALESYGNIELGETITRERATSEVRAAITKAEGK